MILICKTSPKHTFGRGALGAVELKWCHVECKSARRVCHWNEGFHLNSFCQALSSRGQLPGTFTVLCWVVLVHIRNAFKSKKMFLMNFVFFLDMQAVKKIWDLIFDYLSDHFTIRILASLISLPKESDLNAFLLIYSHNIIPFNTL